MHRRPTSLGEHRGREPAQREPEHDEEDPGHEPAEHGDEEPRPRHADERERDAPSALWETRRTSRRSSTPKRYRRAANSEAALEVMSVRSDVGKLLGVPMRVECKNYESRTYPNGETVRKCNLDLAPDAPWRCPDDCPKYERRLADMAWQYGTLVAPPTPQEPPGLDDGSAAALLDEAEEIINAAGTRDPRRGSGRTGSASVLEASAPQAIASDREPLHCRRCSRASGSAVAAFGAGGGGRASARNSQRRPRPRRSGATAASASSTSTGTSWRGPGRPVGAPDAAIAAAVSATKALIPDRAAFVMVVDGQIVLLEVDDALAQPRASRHVRPMTRPRSGRP